MAEVASNRNTGEAVGNILTEDVSFQKLKSDLDAVMEKVTLCREVLQESPGIQEDELLSDLVGFLEACRDRLVDVLEAGSQGLLSEDLFEYALKVNDSLMKTLEAEWTGLKIGVESVKQAGGEAPSLLELDAPYEEATPLASSSSSTPALADDLDLLSLGPTASNTNTDNTAFDPFNTTPAVMPPAPPAPGTDISAAAAASAVDDFDSFFESLK